MRKLIFFLLLIPAIASLGHDVYFFTQDQSKGFQLSDTGALWDKYHKQSHDQWKNKVQGIGEQFENAAQNIGLDQLKKETPMPTETDIENAKEGYLESFTQSQEKGKEAITSKIQQKEAVEENIGTLQKYIGFLLEQKAAFVFTGFALLFYLITAPFARGGGKKEKQVNGRKGGGYKYGRK